MVLWLVSHKPLFKSTLLFNITDLYIPTTALLKHLYFLVFYPIVPIYDLPKDSYSVNLLDGAKFDFWIFVNQLQNT